MEATGFCNWALQEDHRGSGHLKGFENKINTGPASQDFAASFSSLLVLNWKGLRRAPAALGEKGRLLAKPHSGNPLPTSQERDAKRAFQKFKAVMLKQLSRIRASASSRNLLETQMTRPPHWTAETLKMKPSNVCFNRLNLCFNGWLRWRLKFEKL